MFVSQIVQPFSLTHPKKKLVTRLCLKSPSKRFTTLQIHGTPKNASLVLPKKVNLRKTSTQTSNPPSFCWGQIPSGGKTSTVCHLQSEFLQRVELWEADFRSFYRKLMDRCITETHLALRPKKVESAGKKKTHTQQLPEQGKFAPKNGRYLRFWSLKWQCHYWKVKKK